MVADSDKQTFQRIAYALYARFSALWQSRAFLFPTAAIAGVPNVGKSINPKGIDLSRANILVIRSDALGDSILTLPFLRALKRQLPRARVTLAVAKPWKVFFESLHVVDEVIDYPFSADKWKATSRVFGALAIGFKILRKKQFEVVINPRWDADFHSSVSPPIELPFLKRRPRGNAPQTAGWIGFTRTWFPIREPATRLPGRFNC